MSLEAREGTGFERASNLARRAKRFRRSLGLRLRGLARTAGGRFASPLARRIVLLNLGGLAALLLGFLYLNQFREGLIDARVESLTVQGEIIAAAIAASATVETDSIAIDPGKLLQLAPGESYAFADETAPSLEFSINPERIGPVLHKLSSPTKTRARIMIATAICCLTPYRSQAAPTSCAMTCLRQRKWIIFPYGIAWGIS